MLQLEKNQLLRIDPKDQELNELLDDTAQHLLLEFCEQFSQKWKDLMEQRSAVHSKTIAGLEPKTLAATAHIRNSDWTVEPIPQDLAERRVELVIEPDAELMEAGLRSGAKTMVLDLNCLSELGAVAVHRGHLRINALIKGMDPIGTGMMLSPTLMIRPRSFSITSSSVSFNGHAVPACFVDLAIYLGQNAGELLASKKGLYFSLCGIQNHLEARLYNDLFDLAQIELNIPRGSIKATVVLDHILAAFEIEELLFELSHHCTAMALDKWPIYTSFVELFGCKKGGVCPDRKDLRNTSHLFRSISLAMVAACHKRRAHAIGWKSDELPADDRENEYYHRLEMVRKEKEIEVVDGHDGTQVAHPLMVNLATEEFNRYMPRIDQLNYSRTEALRAKDLIMPFGEIRTQGIQEAIDIAINVKLAQMSGMAKCTFEGRLEGIDAYNLCIVQLRNWVNGTNGMVTKTGLTIDPELIKYLVNKHLERRTNKIEEASGKELIQRACSAVLDAVSQKAMVRAAV